MTNRFESTFMLRVANLAPVGNDDLIVTGLTLQSLNNSFTFDEELTFPFSIHPQDHELIPVKFKPDTTGPRTCTARIETNTGTAILQLAPQGTDCSYVTVDTPTIELTNEEQQTELQISADCTWTSDTLPDWLTLDPTTDGPPNEGEESTFSPMLSVAENTGGPAREHTITFTNLTNKTDTLLVKQAQSSPIPSITSSDFEDVCL